ncbi:MAG: protein-disulfide reductase DsbD N-terminal domain-containing protein, partial [Odoribacteraceae bacterium]|nr:protein-disulfide reductase DsbD N-terminal domain-containing protein [Odoribacteraceae bacterium]
PEAAFHYTYFTGPLPDSIPMWKVQTKGYATDTGFRIGMVARPWGFEDSPDAEYISSGVCAKTIDAVAIGRHGNFLHWGFAASPAYMTDEACTVLANAIVYIARFSGQGVIARKYNDRIATREYLKELKYLATRESYEDRLRSEEQSAREIAALQEKLRERVARGEELTYTESIIMARKQTPPIAFEDYIKRYQRDFFHLFGTNSDAYIAFYDANRDYFHGSGFYHIEVDEDAKSLNIPNKDPRLLDAAISLLEKGEDVDKARRLLARYTLVDFDAPGEWRAWYERHRDRLFFTEAGGWLFLVNSREPDVNDYHARDARLALAAIQPGNTNDLNPVKVAAGVITRPDGLRELVVKVRVHPGYHIYANVAREDPFTPTSVDFTLPPGNDFAGELQHPAFTPFTANGTTILEGEFTFRRPISGASPGNATCTIRYQCCDAHLCMPPATEELAIKL